MGEAHIDWGSVPRMLDVGVEIGRAIHSFDRIESTQLPAKEAAKAGAPHGEIWVTDFQDHGRGRRGRDWCAEPGLDLTFSALLRPKVAACDAPLISLVCAVAAADAARRAGVEPSIKWPNDLLVREQKLCGIICECSACDGMVSYAVAGIGINVNREACAEGTTSLLIEARRRDPARPPFDLPRLLASVSSSLDREIRALEDDADAYVRRYAEKCATVGRDVRVITDGEEISGRAVRIDRSGAIVIKTNGAELMFSAADVVHVRAR